MSGKIEELKERGKGKPCGTRTKYVSGCRCSECRSANTRYATERNSQIVREKWDGFVDAELARLHLKALSRKGIGSRTVCEYTGIGRTTVTEIKMGRRKKARKSVIDAILAVNQSCFSGGTLLSAKSAWRDIDWLLSEGFTEAELSKRLGYKTRKLQFKKNRITGRNKVKIQRLVGKLRLGEDE